MNLWTSDNWSKYIDMTNEGHRTGLRLRFEKGVDAEIKRSSLEFCKWLRRQYFFPVRVPIYFKTAECIVSQSGEKSSAIFFGPYDKTLEPYIRVATGDVQEIKERVGKDKALAAVLCSIVHELTHYFQWIKDIDFTATKGEKQALYYRKKIVLRYYNVREHP